MIVGTRHLSGRAQLEQEFRLQELAGNKDLDERGKAEIRRRRAESADQREREFRERAGRKSGADELAARLAARRAAADAAAAEQPSRQQGRRQATMAAEQPLSSGRMPPSMPERSKNQGELNVAGCRSGTAELAGWFSSSLPAEADAPLSRSTSVNSARPGRCAGQDLRQDRGSVGNELAAKLAARRAAVDVADGLERPARDPCVHATNTSNVKYEHAGCKSTTNELFTKLAARRLRADNADQSSRAASVPPAGPVKHSDAKDHLTGICRAPGNPFTGKLATCQLTAEATKELESSNGNSRTPSPPAIAQPPRAPPPFKRRPCAVTRSHSRMRGTDGNRRQGAAPPIRT